MSCGDLGADVSDHSASSLIFLFVLVSGVLDRAKATNPFANLAEPPSDAVHGPELKGISLGIWSEKQSYSEGEIKNVWVIENVEKESRMSMESDRKFHEKSRLTVLQGQETVKVFPIGGVEDGIVGAGFEGGISAELDDLKIGTYTLIWKTEYQTSNPVEISITP